MNHTVSSVLQEDWAARDYIKRAEASMEELNLILQKFGMITR